MVDRVVALKDLGEWKRSYSFSRAQEVRDSPVRHIHYGSIHKDQLSAGIGTPVEPSFVPTSAEFVNEGDIIFADASETATDLGKATIVRHFPSVPTVSGLHTHRLSVNPTLALPLFVYYVTQTERYRKYLAQQGVGSSVLGISKKSLGEFTFSIPSLPEQRKIAEFLGALDEQIENQRERVTLLTQQKQGYMQQIFNRTLRFHDDNGNEYPEWEESELGELFDLRYGKDYKGLDTPNGSYPIFGTGGIIAYTDTPLYDGEAILLGRKGTINRPRYFQGAFRTVDTLFYAVPNEGIDAKFLYYVCTRVDWMKYNAATGVPSLSSTAIKKVEVEMPALPEQQKIADFLSLLDEQIDNQKERLSLLEQQKQGYMQALFTQEPESI